MRKVGRVVGTGHKQFNEWAGKVFCAKHGADEDGGYRHDHYLRRVPERGEWLCSKEYDAGGTETRCASWGDDDRLVRILNYHLYYHVHDMLQRDDTLVNNVVEERRALKRQMDDLRAQVSTLDAERRRQLQRQDDLERRLEGMDAVFRRQQVDTFFEENVGPVMARLAERQRQLREAEENGLVEMGDQSEEEIRRALSTLVFDEEGLSNDKKRELVHTFVDSVEVLVPDHTGECLVYFHWSRVVSGGNGKPVTDTLIASKSLSKDFRAFTPGEDDALRELYPNVSGTSYRQIKERLLPGRKIDAIIRRVYELGIRRPGRSKEWIAACRQSEKTWGQQHTDVLYVLVPHTLLPPSPRLLEHGPEGEWIWDVEAHEVIVGIGQRQMAELPGVIREGLQAHVNDESTKMPWSSLPPP